MEAEFLPASGKRADALHPDPPGVTRSASEGASVGKRPRTAAVGGGPAGGQQTRPGPEQPAGGAWDRVPTTRRDRRGGCLGAHPPRSRPLVWPRFPRPGGGWAVPAGIWEAGELRQGRKSPSRLTLTCDCDELNYLSGRNRPPLCRPQRTLLFGGWVPRPLPGTAMPAVARGARPLAALAGRRPLPPPGRARSVTGGSSPAPGWRPSPPRSVDAHCG